MLTEDFYFVIEMKEFEFAIEHFSAVVAFVELIELFAHEVVAIVVETAAAAGVVETAAADVVVVVIVVEIVDVVVVLKSH